MREGEVVLEVSGRPVFVLSGAIPMYRDIAPGAEGPDVTQLQEALARVGHPPGTSGVFDRATQKALASVYGEAGYRPVRPGPGQTTAPISEIAFVRTLPSTMVGLAGGVGAKLDPSKPALTIARAVQVEARLTVSETKAVSVGTMARVEAVQGGGSFAAEIAHIGSSVTSSSSSGVVGHLIVLRPRQRISSQLIGQSVQITIRVPMSRGRTLVVPLSAVYTGPGGETLVTRIGPGAEQRGIPIRLGASASGYVEIAPLRQGLGPGDRVLVGR